MAHYTIFECTASLSIVDTPLFYQPAYGPAVNFTVSYSQREANQPSTFAYSNLGPLWTFNWLSYITDELKGLVDANGHRTKWNQDIEGRNSYIDQ